MKLKYRVFNGGHLELPLSRTQFCFPSPTWGLADLSYANLNSRSVDDLILSRGIDPPSSRLRDTDLYNLPFKKNSILRISRNYERKFVLRSNLC